MFESRLSIATLVTLTLALGLGCGETKKAEPLPAPTPPQKAAPPAPPSVVSSGEAHVAVSRFEARLKQYGPAFSANLPNVKFLAEAMLDEEILLKEAERRGLDKDPVLAQRLDDYRRQILTTALLERLEPPPDFVKPEAIKEYFEKNPALFNVPERIRVSRISFPMKEKEKAKEVLAKAKKGTAFAELAKLYSNDPSSKDNGGDIGIYQRGGRTDIGDGPFGLKKEKDLGLFETPLEVNVVQLTGRFESREDKFEAPQTQERIRMDLRRQEQEKERQKILKAHKDGTALKFDEEKLSGLVTPPGK
jgi:parvulin-like peptidyl-prolyl isomerase